MESSDKRSEEIEWRRNGKPIQYSCLENPMNSIKMLQYATGDQWRNNSRKNEEKESKQKQHPIVDVTGVGSKSNAIKNNIAKEPGMLGP